jgi:hypothetical protein
MPAWAEMSVNEAVGRQEALGLARRLEPLHLPFAAPGWAMRVLCPIVQVAAFTVLDVRQKLTLRHTIALQLVRDENARHILQTLQQSLEETPRGPGVAAALHQDIEDDAVDVYGFGEQKTPVSFRQACRRFIYIENLLPDVQAATLEEGTSRKALEPPSAAIPILNRAIAQMETEDGWLALGVVGQRLANIVSDFDSRTYGYRKLSDLVRKTGAFDMEQPKGRAMRIRAKTTPLSKARSKATTG